MQNYAREKLMLAVSSLATNARPLNQRLLSAFNSVIRLDDSYFTGEELKEWRYLYHAVSRQDKGFDSEIHKEEGSMHYNINRLNEEEQEDLARKIFELFMSVVKH